jgi:hypothetical protein
VCVLDDLRIAPGSPEVVQFDGEHWEEAVARLRRPEP